jgi:alkaline phosphatase
MKKKIRKLLFALILFLCVNVFVGAGLPATAERQLGNEKEYIFYVIGDGMGEAHLQLGNIYSKVAYGSSAVWEYPSYRSMLIGGAESSQGGSMLATGEKNGAGLISERKDGTELITILDVAKENGYATGIVTNASLADATPAAFYAHADYRNKMDTISKCIPTSEVDYFIGGGKNFLDRNNIEGENIVSVIDYDLPFLYLRHHEKFKHLYEDLPSLLNMTLDAIDYLNDDNDKMFIVIESSAIDGAGHQENDVYAAAEMNRMNSLIRMLSSFDNANIILTADHETGNHSMLDKPIAINPKKEPINLISASRMTAKIAYNAGLRPHSSKHSRQKVPLVLFLDDGKDVHHFTDCKSIVDIPHAICDMMGWEDTLDND